MKPIQPLVGLLAMVVAGCHGAHQRADEIKLASPSGLRWIKVVAKGIE